MDTHTSFGSDHRIISFDLDVCRPSHISKDKPRYYRISLSHFSTKDIDSFRKDVENPITNLYNVLSSENETCFETPGTPNNYIQTFINIIHNVYWDVSNSQPTTTTQHMDTVADIVKNPKQLIRPCKVRKRPKKSSYNDLTELVKNWKKYEV